MASKLFTERPLQYLCRQRTPLTAAFARSSRPSSLRKTTLSVYSNQRRRTFASFPSLQAKKYTKDHEWIELDDSGKIGTIGVSHYAAKALGDVVYVELPEVDSEVAQGDTIGAVESVKSASDILTPVSGKITEANGNLEEKPATINKSPETDGWIARIEVAEKSELDALMDADAYETFTGEEDQKH